MKWVADGTFLAATGEKLLSCDIASGDSPLKVSGHLDLEPKERPVRCNVGSGVAWKRSEVESRAN